LCVCVCVCVWCAACVCVCVVCASACEWSLGSHTGKSQDEAMNLGRQRCTSCWELQHASHGPAGCTKLRASSQPCRFGGGRQWGSHPAACTAHGAGKQPTPGCGRAWSTEGRRSWGPHRSCSRCTRGCTRSPRGAPPAGTAGARAASVYANVNVYVYTRVC